MSRKIQSIKTRDKKLVLEESIYTPARAPGKAFCLISFIVAVGIIGTALYSKFFMVFATIFWMQYTVILSYVQFLKGSKYEEKAFIDKLLNPQVRFFTFIFLATLGLLGSLAGMRWIGYLALVSWWLFSLNFYLYFKEFK
ncbi:hypothetical protein JXC34_02560, partial [Candidatus Woesearchaeota archaeon]|nr:hypothetical protein [Candidatus Woesearchaeota archaeon]